MRNDKILQWWLMTSKKVSVSEWNTSTLLAVVNYLALFTAKGIKK